MRIIILSIVILISLSFFRIRASVESWTGDALEDIAIIANSEWQIFNLRRHVEEKYEIAASSQYWFFGNKHAADNFLLSRIDKDVKIPLLTAQLYLRPALDCDPLGRKDPKDTEADGFEFVNAVDVQSFRPNSSDPNPFASLSSKTVARQLSESQPLSLRPNANPSPMIRNATDPLRLDRSSSGSPPGVDVDTGSARVFTPKTPPPPPKSKPKEPAPPAGWVCPTCTFVNVPTRPGCEMCAADRPADYKPTADDERNLTPNERRRLQLLREAEAATKQVIAPLPSIKLIKYCFNNDTGDNHSNFPDCIARLSHDQMKEQEDEERVLHRLQSQQELERLAAEALLVNDQEFECAICLADVAPGDGVRLHQCLHQFCKSVLPSSSHF